MVFEQSDVPKSSQDLQRHALDVLHRDIKELLAVHCPKANLYCHLQTEMRVTTFEEPDESLTFESVSYLELGNHHISQRELTTLRRVLRSIFLYEASYHEAITKIRRKTTGTHALKVTLTVRF